MAAKPLSGVPDQFIECKFFVFHAMERIPYDGNAPTRWRLAKGAEICLFRCIRCAVKRYDVYSRSTGTLVDRIYRKPDNYVGVPRFDGRRQAIVKEYLNRTEPGKKPQKKPGRRAA